MSWRRQPPVWSPLSAGAIRAGFEGRHRPESLARLHAALEEEFGARRALLVGSGTVALTLAIRGARQDDSPVVALPAWGCYDLATAADGAQARVLLYDLDPKTLGPDEASLRAAAAGAPDVVVVAHFFGIPVDLGRVRAIVGAGPLLVDDAAQGAGARFRGRPLGVAGDVGVLSFGRGKGRTGGRGGALLASSDRGLALLERAARALSDPPARTLRDLAAVTAQWLLGRPGLYRVPAAVSWLHLGETIYHPPPRPEGMAPFAAAVALANREANRVEDQARRAAGAWWTERLAESGAVEPIHPPEGSDPGWLRFPVVAGPEAVDLLSSAQVRGLGVMPGYPLPLARLPGFERRAAGEWSETPGASRLAGRLFTLPTHSRMGSSRRRAFEAVMDRVGQRGTSERGGTRGPG